MLALSSIYLILIAQNSWGLDQKLDELSCGSQHSLKLSLANKIIRCVCFLIFIFVLVSLIPLYWKILQKLRQVQLSAQTTFNSQTFRNSKRNMLVLIVIFCVCFVPFHLVHLPAMFIQPLLHDCSALHVLHILKELSTLFAGLNASLDPLIYFLFSRAFRAHFNFTSCQDCP